MDDLKSNQLESLKQLVIQDRTLDLEIRDGYLNIYYRGGSLLKIKELGAGSYEVDFDSKYLNTEKNLYTIPITFPCIINTAKETDNLLQMIPSMKQIMDLWFGIHPKDEREFQQLVARENNRGNTGQCTDYLICDIGYTSTQNRNLRFDMIAAHWPSTSSERRRFDQLNLAIIEMKYGDGALGGSSGIQKHLNDLLQISLPTIKREMENVLAQKAELGLLHVHDLDRKQMKPAFMDGPNEWILLLANHDPAKSGLKAELEGVQRWVEDHPEFPFKVKIAVANLMGYGLYDESVYSLETFLEKFKEQIYH
jgi:hypothetical protein